MPKTEDEARQPALLGLDEAPPRPVETHVDYGPGFRRRRPETAADPSEAPWWTRARQVEQSRTPTALPQPACGAEWNRLLRAEGWVVELASGKRALLERSVRNLEIRPGVIEASVGLGAEKPERVQLRSPPVGLAEWTRLARHVVDRKSEGAVIDGLGRGDIPLALVDAADSNGTSLLPRRLGFLASTCTCGGASLPCDHVLSVHLRLAQRLYREPHILLAFRGMDRAELPALLARVREEASAVRLPHVPVSQGDPYAGPEAPEPDWARLARPAVPRQPLPAPEGWRATEGFDALVRRVVAAAARAVRGRPLQ